MRLWDGTFPFDPRGRRLEDAVKSHPPHHAGVVVPIFDEVDEDHIGLLDICGGDGDAIDVMMTERRFRMAVSITGVTYGRSMREAFSGFEPIAALEAMAKQRTAEDRSSLHLSTRQ